MIRTVLLECVNEIILYVLAIGIVLGLFVAFLIYLVLSYVCKLFKWLANLFNKNTSVAIDYNRIVNVDGSEHESTEITVMEVDEYFGGVDYSIIDLTNGEHGRYTVTSTQVGTLGVRMIHDSKLNYMQR